MKRFYRYKEDGHDIKLELVGKTTNDDNLYKAVAGLNVQSKQWFNEYGSIQRPSHYWKNVVPYDNEKHSFICNNPCNKPGDMIK